MPIKENYLLFLDTETGGLVPGKSPVIEVAAILARMDGSEIARYASKILLEEGQAVDYEAAAVNGYNKDLWLKEGRPFHQFREWLKTKIPFGSVAIAVGHNVRFDRDMIDLGYYKPARLFCPISYRTIDTQAIAMILRFSGKVQVEDVKLGTIARALGLEKSFHAALADCEAARDIYLLAQAIFKEADLTAIGERDERFGFLRRRPALVKMQGM